MSASARTTTATRSPRIAAAPSRRSRRARGWSPSTRSIRPTPLYAAAPWPDDARPHADAMVTDRPGLALGILTADCAPVLLADREAGVIGAAHAGWKGAFGGVIEVDGRGDGGARRRARAASPPRSARSSPARSYEVDEAFLRRFAEADPDERALLHARPRRPSPVRPRSLCRSPASPRPASTRAEALGLDTYSDPDRFFSYRRATHRGEPDYGRQISLIALAGLASARAGSAREPAGNGPHPWAAPASGLEPASDDGLGLHAAMRRKET